MTHVSRPSSTTGSAPTSSLFISRAASLVVSGVIAVGFDVIASCTLWCPIWAPFVVSLIGGGDVLGVAGLLLRIRNRRAVGLVVAVVLRGC